MLVREARRRPSSWVEHRQIRHRWALPFYGIEWAFQWVAYFLSRWAFLEVVEYLGILSVLFAVIFYYSEAGDRRKQKHYQAWQVINTAQGKGGSGGRIEALQELNADGVPLVGVDVSGSFLQGIELRRTNLMRANLEAVDLRNSSLEGSDLEYASLRSANFRHSNLRATNLQDADMEGADLVSATLDRADLTRANLKNADLRNADLQGLRWQKIRAIDSANVYGVRNAPEGFVAWALQHGAISVRNDEE
jgi:Pentapeptide repeats (8 copies)